MRNVEAIVEANVEAVNLTNKDVEAIEPILTTLAGEKKGDLFTANFAFVARHI